MIKRVLIVVHGMGSHTADSVKQEVLGSFKKAYKLYPSLQGKDVENQFDIVCFAYNQAFEDLKKQLPTQANELLKDLIEKSPTTTLAVELFQAFAGIDDTVLKDTFFASHWLDVILYRTTYLCEPIRLGLAKLIMDEVIARGSARVQILGHSLGTSVVHDTLAKMYGSAPYEDQQGNPLKLLPDPDRLGGVHMVANVSRVLQTFEKAGDSQVRPGVGCVGLFYEYRHQLDPVTRVKPFDPHNNREWVPNDTFEFAYRLEKPSEVTATNVHALTHYLDNPTVHSRILGAMRAGPRKSEIAEAQAKYNQGTLQGKANALRRAFEGLETSKESVLELLQAAIALRDMVQQAGEKF